MSPEPHLLFRPVHHLLTVLPTLRMFLEHLLPSLVARLLLMRSRPLLTSVVRRLHTSLLRRLKYTLQATSWMANHFRGPALRRRCQVLQPPFQLRRACQYQSLVRINNFPRRTRSRAPLMQHNLTHRSIP